MEGTAVSEPRTEASSKRGVMVRCPLGGPAPCIDDLCHSVDTTLCGLEWGYDFCDHEYDPDTCPECSRNWPDEDD